MCIPAPSAWRCERDSPSPASHGCVTLVRALTRVTPHPENCSTARTRPRSPHGRAPRFPGLSPPRPSAWSVPGPPGWAAGRRVGVMRRALLRGSVSQLPPRTGREAFTSPGSPVVLSEYAAHGGGDGTRNRGPESFSCAQS